MSTIFFILGFFSSYLWLLAIFFLVIFLKSYISFYMFVVSKKPKLIFQIFSLSIVFTNVVALGSLWGLTKVVLGKSDIYKKFRAGA